MYRNINEFFEKNRTARMFALIRLGKKVPIHYKVMIVIKAIFFELPIALILSFPTSIGFGLRQLYFNRALKKCGVGCIFGQRLKIDFPSSVELSEYVWIDHDVTIATAFGRVSIGRRVHVAPYSIISGGGEVEIGDYVGIASFAQIYSHSESPINGLRMSGPMIPEEYKGFKTKKVVLSKDSFIGAGAIILPGVNVGEGAVVAANSVVTRDVPPWAIVSGVPARVVGTRSKVRTPDI